MGTATAPRVVTGHIGLNVSDLERSIAFYRQAFGFDELAVSADGAQRFAEMGTWIGHGLRLAASLSRECLGEIITGKNDIDG
ncbi:Lactoylglutathione lyase [Mycobacteroides abscessus]|nr:Lactoylglutathione lyase [Mycobacteroides abscessus]